MSSPATPTSANRISTASHSIINYGSIKLTPPDFGNPVYSGPSPASTSAETPSAVNYPGSPLAHFKTCPSVSVLDSSRFPSDQSLNYDMASPLAKFRTSGTMSNSPLQGSSSPSQLRDAMKQIASIYETDTITLHNSPTQRQKTTDVSSFVQGPPPDSEDPFTSVSNKTFLEGVSLANATCTPSRVTQSANVTPNHRVIRGSIIHTTPTSSGRRSTKLANITVVESFPSPREERRKQTPCAENAQGLYSTEACVFVANLASTCSDEVLNKEVDAVFRQFGTVYVKIRRDNKGMPYAFCQYETKAIATAAIAAGKDKIICARPCRTEFSKAHRALYISKHDGSIVTVQDIRELLAGRGDLDKVWTSTDTEKEVYQLPLGMWVRFFYYQDCQDARAALRHDPVYKLDTPLEPTKGSGNRSGRNMRNGAQNYSSPMRGPMSNFAMGGEETRTVYVGNLPLNINQQELCAMFSFYGAIATAQIISNVKNMHRIIVHGFVEFMAQNSAAMAAKGENGKYFRGHKIKVERDDPSFHQSRSRYTSPTLQRNRGTGHNFNNDMSSVMDQNAQNAFYQHPHAQANQQYFGGFQGGFDPAFSMAAVPSMYAGNNVYGYYPSAQQVHDMNQSTTSSHGQTAPNGSEVNASGFITPAPLPTQFAPDWFVPAAQRQLNNYVSTNMQLAAPSNIHYAQGHFAYAPNGTTYYPYPSQPSSANSYTFQQSSAPVENTVQPARAAATVVESH